MDTIFAFGKERKVWVNSGYEVFKHPLLKRSFLIHRFIYEQANGPIPVGMNIHHIDENKLNNSLDNLEIISHSDHISLHKNKGGGVYWNKDRQKWRAQVYQDGKQKHLGYFPTQSEAYQALFDNDPGYWTRQKQLKVKL